MLEWMLHFDRALFILINSAWTHPWLDAFFPFITDLHKTYYFKIVLVPLVFALFIRRRGFKKGSVIFLFALLSVFLSDGIGTHLFKNNVERERPFNDPELHAIQRSPAAGFSFVSNHAGNNFAFATFVGAFFPAARIFVFMVACLVSYSRIYNGVHYPSDILAAALMGILIGLVMIKVCRWALARMENTKEVSR